MAAASTVDYLNFYSICDWVQETATTDPKRAIWFVLEDICDLSTGDRYEDNNPAFTDSWDPRFVDVKTDSRCQSAYRTFLQWATSEARSNAAQNSAYNLSGDPITHAPASSAWRTALYEMEHNNPLDHDVLRDLANDDYVPEIQRPKVFFSFLARTWRDADDEFQNVFYAIAALRTLALAVRWGRRYSFWYKMNHPSHFGEVATVNILRSEPIDVPHCNSYVNIPLWKVPFHYHHGCIFIDAELPDDSKEVRLAWTFNLYGKYKHALLASGITHTE